MPPFASPVSCLGQVGGHGRDGSDGGGEGRDLTAKSLRRHRCGSPSALRTSSPLLVPSSRVHRPKRKHNRCGQLAPRALTEVGRDPRGSPGALSLSLCTCTCTYSALSSSIVRIRPVVPYPSPSHLTRARVHAASFLSLLFGRAFSASAFFPGRVTSREQRLHRTPQRDVANPRTHAHTDARTPPLA